MLQHLPRVVLVFFASFGIGAGLLFFLHEPVDDSFPIGADFYPRWVGSRAFWSGTSPYTDAVTLQSQQLVFKGQNVRDIKAFAFYYPAYLAVIILPLAFLPVEVAGIIWSAAMWAVLATIYLCWSWQLRPRLAPIAWGFALTALVLFRPSIVGVLSGQFAPFVLACLLLSWWLISVGEDMLAGMVLLLATVKPSLALLATLVLLLWSFRWKRWKIALGFSIGIFLLTAITLNRIGWWLPDFIHQTLGYANDSRGLGLAWSPEAILTPLGFVWLVGTALLLGRGLRDLWRSREFPWIAVFAGINLNLLASPHVYDYDLMMLLILLLWLGNRWLGYFWGLLLWVLLVSVPLILSILSSFEASLAQYMSGVWLFYPNLLLATLLVWTSREHFQYRLRRLFA